MGRLKIKINEETLLEKRGQQKSIKEIAGEMGLSTATLSRRIAELENNQGILTKYRELQGLQLSALQFRVLQAITPEMIESASLVDLVRCFGILKRAEVSKAGASGLKVTGLLQYLIELEAKEFSADNYLPT